MSISPLERAGAAVQEEIHSHWRDWTRYLQAHLTLLDARAAERRVAFERDETLEEQASQARAALATLPQDRRALFDQLCEERRQAVQAAGEATASHPGDDQPLDPDAIERQALQTLLAAAHGEQDPAGWGVVPIRDGATVNWYEVHAAALRAAPTAAAYALGTSDGGGMRMRYLLAGLLIVGGVLFLLVWFLWPREGRVVGEGRTPQATANGVALIPWPVVAVVVERAGQGRITLPVLTGAAEPPGGADPARLAAWDPAQLAPLRLCLPPELLAQARAITLLSGEGRPDRVYAMVPTGAPDLLLEPCGGDAPPRAAALQQVAAPADAAVGDARALDGEATARLTAVTITGPGDDPTLPAGQARVTLQARAPIADWAAYAPTLLLAGGQALLPAEAPVSAGGLTTLRYLVPLPTSPAPAVWSLTPPQTGRPIRWRAMIPTPPDRAAVVREALAVIALAPELRDGTLTLTLTVRNERDLPFVLTPADLVLTRASGGEQLPLAIPALAALAAPLAPGATRTLVLTAALRGGVGEPLIFSAGAARFRITGRDGAP